jgi:hypothetical protein
MFETRKYAIIHTSQIDSVNFSDVLETSADTCRYSVDGTKTFVKWEGEMPECVAVLVTAEGPYTHDEILEVLSSDEWTPQEEEVV